ncbi:MAG: beta-ketoacyl-[acyl-carrier-protein] synthase family protein [Nocardioidaceae bacterium]
MSPAADLVPAPVPVAVVGMGVKAPGGTCVDALWESVCAGRSFAEPYVDARLPADARTLVSRVTGFDPAGYLSPIEVRRLDRSHALAVGAAQDAVDDLRGGGAGLPAPERCAVVCGVGLAGAATYEEQHVGLLAGSVRTLSPLTIPLVMPSATAALLAMRFGFTGPSLTVSAACASGAAALAEGIALLRADRADLVLAGGVDALLTYGVVCGFLRLDAMSHHVEEPERASRPFDVARDGFVLGEGAGFVVLQRAADVGPGVPVHGLLLGHASTADAHHLVAPDPEGAGAARCIRLALADAGIGPAEVGHVNAHGTSTVLNDRAEAAALVGVFGAEVPPVTAVKGSTGHLVGGSGAVEAIVALRSLAEGTVPPVSGLVSLDPQIPLDVVAGRPRRVHPDPVLSSSFGFGGANTCLVLAAQ